MDVDKKQATRSRLTIVLFATYALLAIGIILFKLPFNYNVTATERTLNLIPFAGLFTGGTIHANDIVENVLVFVPFGIYLSMLKPNWSFGKKLLMMAATSVAFEVIQYVFSVGRSDITDVISNTVGGVIGVGVFLLLSRVLGRNTTRVINIVCLVLTVAVVLEFAFLFWVSNVSRR